MAWWKNDFTDDRNEWEARNQREADRWNEAFLDLDIERYIPDEPFEERMDRDPYFFAEETYTMHGQRRETQRFYNKRSEPMSIGYRLRNEG